MSNFLDNPIYSNASQVLGMEVTHADHEKGIIEASFKGSESFCNFSGKVHGGMLVAMLDDLMGYALGITLPRGEFAPTANLNVSFLRPASVGLLHGKGQVLKQDGEVYHLAAKLYNGAGEMVASATSKAVASK